MSDYEYKKARYDSILFRVKKGKADEYRQSAQDLGIGFWELIQSAVEEFIANHAGGDFLPIVKPASIAPPIEKLTSQEKTLLTEFNRLPPSTQKIIVKLIRDLATQARVNDAD